MNALIVFPMHEERTFFLRGCTEEGLNATEGQIGKVSVARLKRPGFTLAVGGLGKVQFALQTQHLIDSGPKWDAVICAGAAGALDERVAVGDVVVGTATIEYDIHNQFGKPLLPRFKSDSYLVEQFKRVDGKSLSFKIHFGALASGDEDIVDSQRRRQVRALTHALASAWEGAGGARACQFSSVPFVEIRGISDAANETAADDFEKNLPSTMRNVATVIMHWASNSPDV